MQDAPPDSIGVVDTMGCALPEAIKYLVRKVKNLTGIPVEIHTHNDFGMAAATELAAVTAGAEVVHSCANGLGERTGNAALEELMIGLHTLYEFKKIIDRKLPQEHSLMSPDVRMLACVAYKKRLLRNAPPLLFRMKVSHKRYLIPA